MKAAKKKKNLNLKSHLKAVMNLEHYSLCLAFCCVVTAGPGSLSHLGTEVTMNLELGDEKKSIHTVARRH